MQPVGVRSGGVVSPTLQRWVIGAPDPALNTIVCDGSGGITTQLNAVGDANQVRCRRDCVEAHEQSHKADALYENAKICEGVAAGKTVRPKRGRQKNQTEVDASNAELDCLTPKLPTADATCRPIIEARVTQMKEYRQKYRDLGDRPEPGT